MQKLVAYLLEHESDSDRGSTLSRVRELANAWLVDKGSVDPTAEVGTFNSLTSGQNALFSRREATLDDRTWFELRLEESALGNHAFEAVLSVIDDGRQVAVHISLSGGAATTIVAPVSLEAFCPKIVRSLLAEPIAWRLAGEAISPPNPMHLRGHDAGIDLALSIGSETRKLPLVVISESAGRLPFPTLPGSTASDLAGLASIVTIDEHAQESLAERLGWGLACYEGAVRVYWPGGLTAFHPVWPAPRIAAAANSAQRAAEIFRRHLRKLVFAVAAASIRRPPAIATLRLASSTFGPAVEHGNVPHARERVERRILELEGRADEAPPLLLLPTSSVAATLGPGAAEPSRDQQPPRGDTRFYKKVSSPDRDRMVSIQDCEHAAWQSAAKAEKAKKGIGRLEGSTGWKTIHHCGTCTGGGVYRVRW